MEPTSLKESWERDGYVIVRRLFSKPEVARMRAHFMAWVKSDRREDFDRLDKEKGEDPLAKYPRIIHPHRRDELSLQFLLDPRLRNAMIEFLGQEPLAAQTMFYFKPPGARGQALHQDQMYLRAAPGTCLAAWLAVDDCDQDNGCMDIVPGSHRLPILCGIEADTTQSFTHQTVPVPPGYEAIPALMKAGDVLFFHGNLIHGSGPNRSSTRFRRALIAHYITADAKEAATFYHPLLRWDGSEADLENAPSGSQCGMVSEEGIEMVAVTLGELKEPH